MGAKKIVVLKVLVAVRRVDRVPYIRGTITSGTRGAGRRAISAHATATVTTVATLTAIAVTAVTEVLPGIVRVGRAQNTRWTSSTRAPEDINDNERASSHPIGARRSREVAIRWVYAPIILIGIPPCRSGRGG